MLAFSRSERRTPDSMSILSASCRLSRLYPSRRVQTNWQNKKTKGEGSARYRSIRLALPAGKQHGRWGSFSMKTTELIVNGERRATDVDPNTPLLWVRRATFGLTGTKFGCGIAQCGACTVSLEGDAVRSCVTPLSRAAGKRVTTVEGLSKQNTHVVQQAWLA